MLPKVDAQAQTTGLLFLAEALKAKGTGMCMSTREMTQTAVWSNADVTQASTAHGKAYMDAVVNAAVQFMIYRKSARLLGAK